MGTPRNLGSSTDQVLRATRAPLVTTRTDALTARTGIEVEMRNAGDRTRVTVEGTVQGLAAGSGQLVLAPRA